MTRTNTVVVVAILAYCTLTTATFWRIEPRNETVLIGKTVTLHCAINSTHNGKVYWIVLLDGQYLSIGNSIREKLDPNIRARYAIVGNSSAGEFHLQIKNVSKSDEKTFLCAYIGTTPLPPRQAKLTVLVPPSKDFPKCVTDPPGELSVGQEVTIACISLGGDPPTRLEWQRHDGKPSISKVGRYAHTFTLKPKDNGMVFTCIGRSKALDKPRSCQLMPLRIPPVAVVHQQFQPARIGMAASFSCKGEAVPHVKQYYWTLGDQLITKTPGVFDLRDNNRTLVILKSRGAYNGTEVTCFVDTPSGLSTKASTKFILSDSLPIEELLYRQDFFFYLISACTSALFIILIIAIVVGCLLNRSLRLKQAEEKLNAQTKLKNVDYELTPLQKELTHSDHMRSTHNLYTFDPDPLEEREYACIGDFTPNDEESGYLVPNTRHTPPPPPPPPLPFNKKSVSSSVPMSTFRPHSEVVKMAQLVSAPQLTLTAHNNRLPPIAENYTNYKQRSNRMKYVDKSLCTYKSNQITEVEKPAPENSELQTRLHHPMANDSSQSRDAVVCTKFQVERESSVVGKSLSRQTPQTQITGR
ncbi:uncharacterized protein LOC117120868 [Anneissia japonica]|uniref:uncharacterized protein LOC117120868 n=1 Tax=Anneissia japonica TaxID=1529436 RepID=UPI001425B751|nr:uncharacterized protein LOC117120868 [Anneissia japonica]